MLQEGDDELAVMIERCGSAHERHQAVGAGERKQTVDFCVGQPLRNPPQHELPAQLRSEPLAPAHL